MNTLDDELIRQLCADLDVLTADVSAVPPPLTPPVGVARVVALPAPHRHRRVIVLAAAMVALIAGVAGLVAIRRDNDAAGSPGSAPESAPVMTYAATSPGVVHPTPPSPEGWDLVEWGNVRLSLPPEMSPFRPENGCVATPVEADLEIVCGDQSVRVGSAASDAVTDQIVNGLHVSWQAGDCVGCQTSVLPELASTVIVRRGDDASANSVLDTVGPSGFWRFGNELRPTPPAEWKTVTFEGVSVRVPSDWPIQTVADTDPTPCAHGVLPNTVLLDRGLPSRCDDPLLLAPADGVRLYLAEPPLDINPGWPEQLVTVENGDAATVAFRVGYGADPSVGLSILNSFVTAADTETSSTYAMVLQDVPYLAVGESVMLGAKPNLDNRGIVATAGVSTGPSWTLKTIREFKMEHRVTRGVVIQLGTNGSVTREEYEAILAEFSDLNRVLVLTVKAPKPWIDANNEIIRSLPETHPNVVIVDWEARSAEVADHLSDVDSGVHLRDDVAKEFFTNVILEALGLPTH